MGDVTLLPPEVALGSPELLGLWRAMLGGVNRLNRLFASPDWFEHVRRTDPETELRLGAIRDGSGRYVGVCPIAVRPVPLNYDVASRVLARSTVRAAVILGGEPMLPQTPDAYR